MRASCACASLYGDARYAPRVYTLDCLRNHIVHDIRWQNHRLRFFSSPKRPSRILIFLLSLLLLLLLKKKKKKIKK